MMFNSPAEAADYRAQFPKCNWGARMHISDERKWARQSPLAVENNCRRAFDGLAMIEASGVERHFSGLVA